MCSTRIQGPFYFIELMRRVSPGSPQAQDTLQSPVAGGLSLEGTAGFPQKLREAAAASYGSWSQCASTL